MIKPYSKKKLRRLNKWFAWTLYKSEHLEHSINYIKTINRDVQRFQNKLKIENLVENNEIVHLTDLFSTAVYFRANKKIIKDFISNTLAPLIVVCLLFQPFVYISYFTNAKFHIWDFVLVYLICYISIFFFFHFLGKLIAFIDNFQVKIGKTITELIGYLLFGSLCLILYASNQLETNIIKVSIWATVILIYSFLLLAILIYIIKVFVDFNFYSRKIQITDALIIESCYQLCNLNWESSIKKRNQRQKAINEIERLAGLIEIDWSLHIKAKDEKSNSWKNKTLKGIAEGLRSLKREVMIPSSKTSSELKIKFELIFKKILLHDIMGLIGAEVPAIRIRKKSKFRILRNLLVAILPFAIVLSFKIFPIMEIPKNYLNIGLIIASLWMLISFLVWVDPNLADKIATVKSFKSTFKSGSED